MIALLIGLIFAAPVDIERSRASLEQGDVADAVEHARVAVNEEPANWRAQWVYADALHAAGLEHRVRAELEPVAQVDPQIAVILAWHKARIAESSAGAMARISEAGESAEALASLALGALALESGNAPVASTVLAEVDLPEALSVRLAAAIAQGEDREAGRLVDALIRRFPERPDLMSPLFGVPDARSPLRRAQRQALRHAAALGTSSEDAAVVYRARTLLVSAGDDEAAEPVVARLVRLGEPELPPRRGYSPVMRRTLARGLAMQRNPSIPQGPRDEMRDIGVAVAISLRDLGRIPEALAVWTSLREQVDDSELATAHARQMLRTGRADEAAEIAQEAVQLALLPSQTDRDRSAVRAWQHELATAHAVLAEALLSAERPDEALQPAVFASLLAPTDQHLRLRAAVFQVLGQDEAAWSSLAVAFALGGNEAGALEGSYPGVGFWGDAARDAAHRWSDETGAELPRRDVGNLPERPERPIVDAPFPSWTAQGTDFGSESLRGQVVVMAFWASWCGPCKRELPEMDAKAAEWERLGVKVVAVSTDDQRRDYDRYLTRNPLARITPVHGPEIGARMGVSALPTTWVIDREGIARHFHQGYGPQAIDVLDAEVRQLAR